MARPPQPEDLARFRIPTDPAVAPDGGLVAFTVQRVAPGLDRYRHEVWAAPADGGEPARALAATGDHDRHARFSPDGRWLAFLSDRRWGDEPAPATGSLRGAAAGSPHDQPQSQVYLLPLRGGEPRRLTGLPRGVEDGAWSPDSSSLVVVAADGPASPDRREGEPPPSDYRYIDRLGYMLNGAGFLHDRVLQLLLVDVETGEVRPLTRGRTDVSGPAWSPDGREVAFAADRSRDFDLRERSDICVVDVATGRERVITGGRRAVFRAPCWLPDDRTIAAIGHRLTAGGGTRADLWLFAADGSDAAPDGGRNLTAEHDLMLGTGMAGDLTPSEWSVLRASRDGRWISFIAPDNRGAAELWRVRVDDGRVERLTQGRHQISAFDAVSVRGRTRYAVIRSDPTTPAEVEVLDVPDRASRRLPARRRVSDLNGAALADIDLVEPEERWTEVDGRQIQGWFYPAQGDRAAGRGTPPPPLVTQIHGGPHAYYGWTPMWEFHMLAGAGMSVYASNPRGSEGYGEAFNAANYRDWADGPARDVLAGIDALVAEGRADPDRLGLTGGSYGGYLTTWILAHDSRFRTALAARSVSDMAMLMLTGDISGAEFGRQEFGVAPWEDPDYYRAISPLTYAHRIRTPLLIQHAEQDIRTTVGQAEALFTVLRSLRRPVRFMRVPEESHELTRSGTPFRRIENLVQVRDWFAHFLVKGRRTMPPVPKVRPRSPAAGAARPAAATQSGGRRRARKAL